MQLSFPVVADGEFPHGLRCTGCKRDIEVGQPYQEIPMGISGQIEEVLLACVYCTSESIDWERVPHYDG